MVVVLQYRLADESFLICGDSILCRAYSMTTMMTLTTMTMMMMSIFCDGCLAVQTLGLDWLSQLW